MVNKVDHSYVKGLCNKVGIGRCIGLANGRPRRLHFNLWICMLISRIIKLQIPLRQRHLQSSHCICAA